MTDPDRYEAKALMHRIRYERDERTPELVKRLAGYIGWHLAVEFDRVVERMDDVELLIDIELGK